MADITHASYAVAGSGDVDGGNASALLDDFLPQALGAVYRPTRVPRSQKSLSGVINWLESDDVLRENGTVPSDNLIESLLLRRMEGDDVALIVIWPDEPGEDEIALVTAARAEGIRVLSLGDAIDDLLWEPEPEAPEVPAEPEAAAPTGDIEDDLVQAAVGAIDGVAEQLAHSFTESLALFVRRIVRDELNKASAAAAAPAPPAKEKAKAPARRSSRSAPSGGHEEIEDGSSSRPGQPKFSGDGGAAPDDPNAKIKYYVNEDGQYRLAKSRPRRGEQPALLTPDEVDALVKKGDIAS